MIKAHIQSVLVTIGFLTMGSLVFFLAPSVLGKRLLNIKDIIPGVTLLTRHWAFLVFLVGVFLVYAAFDPPCRFPALLMASAEKIAFMVLILLGPLRTSRAAQMAAAGDGLLALLCLTCLLGL